jgi:hypothetical protein
MGIGGFVYSARTGTSLTIEPGTPIEECMEAMQGHLDPDTISALSRSSALAKSRHAPRVLVADESYSEADRDELVEHYADERILRFAYAVEQKAALNVASERLFDVAEKNAGYVSAALHQALAEKTPVPQSPEVIAHALVELRKQSASDGDSARALIDIFNRAEVLSREMLRLAADE